MGLSGSSDIRGYVHVVLCLILIKHAKPKEQNIRLATRSCSFGLASAAMKQWLGDHVADNV